MKPSSRKFNSLPPIVFKKKEKEGLEIECDRFIKCSCDTKCSKEVAEFAEKFDIEVIKKKLVVEILAKIINYLRFATLGAALKLNLEILNFLWFIYHIRP